jgi:hypothetical protein
MPDSEDRFNQLEDRVRSLEDRLAIYQLMSTYGPSADSGSGDVVETLFTESGEYDSGIDPFHGAAAIRDMIEHLPLHRSLMAAGCAHLMTMPLVQVDGDRAVAICHSQLLRHEDDGFRVWRTSATRLDFERTPGGWRIARRVNRLLDGSASPRDLFREVLVAGEVPAP